jgi:uncharacterized protein YcbK (DUF882 family)
MKLTKNFKREEFDCRDGTKVPSTLLHNTKQLAQNLQVLRDFFDAPVTINSGYRTRPYNKKVGGAVSSQHLLGTAADIVVEGVSSAVVADTTEALIRCGAMKEGGLGRYKSFTHYDIRGKKARWQG